MKKVLILALSIFTVIFMATAVLAAETSYEGKVEVKWANDPAAEEDATGFEGSREAKVFFDYTKDYGDGVTAGLKTMMEAPGGTFNFDGEGWIKFDYDLFAVKAATDIGGGVGNDFGEFGLSGAPGVEVVAVPVDGFTLTGVVNGGYGAGYRLLAKGEYAADLFSVGGGYQTERGAKIGDDQLAKTALGVYGSFNVMDNLTVKGEYGSRKEGQANDEDALTGILVNANYEGGGITADASYLMVDKGFDIISDDDDDPDWLARDVIKNGTYKGSVVFVDASYAVSDMLKVLGSLDYILAAEDENGNDVTEGDDWNGMSYKLGVESQLTDKVKAEGWYKSFGKDGDKSKTQLGAKATYVFVDGVEGSFELTNDSVSGNTSYTVTLTAAL